MKRLSIIILALALILGLTLAISQISAQAPEKKAPEKKAPEKKAPEKKAPEKKAAEKKAEPKGEPIKIGAIFDVTGKNSSLGTPEKQTVEMLVEQINAQGGILGRKLEVIVKNDEGDETKTVTMAKELINNDKVKVIIGPTTTGTSMAILDTINSAQIPLVSCAAGWKIVTDDQTKQARKWVFKTPPSDSMVVEKLFDYLSSKLNISKIAIMSVSNGYGDSGKAEMERLAPNFKIDIVANERFGKDDVDMKAQLTKIKGTEAKAIIVWDTPKGPAIVAQNAKELGLTQLIVQSHGVANKKFIELCGDAADGQILAAGRLIVASQLPDTDPQKALLVKYKSDFESKFKDSSVSTFGGHAYDALMIAKKAIEIAGSDDPAKIRDALEQVKDFPGTGGVFAMSATDHNGLTKDAVIMIEIKNKDWQLIK